MLTGGEDDLAAGRAGRGGRPRGALVRRGRGVLLAGPSGVGKTSLASLGRRRSRTRRLDGRARGRQPDGRHHPVRRAGRAAAPGPAPADGGTASAQVRAGIASLAAGRPSLVVVDDAQWLDEASAVVLHQLVAQGDVTVAGDVRTGRAGARTGHRPVEGRPGRPHRGGAARRRVGARVLEAALDGPVETLTATRLWRRCSGNALYLRELVGEAARLDLFQRRDGLWCIDRLPPGSPRLAELVAQRLGALDDTSGRRSR